MRPASTRSVVALVLTCLLQSGCAITYSVDKQRLPDSTDHALVPRWPVAVGVYYAPDVRKTEANVADAARVPIGAEVTSMFRWALNQMFAEVIEVSELPPARPAPAGALGIVALQRVDVAPAQRRLTYAIELRTPEGYALDQWEAAGSAPEDPAAGPMFMPFGSITAWAIRDATATFMVGLADRPAVRDWLGTIGVTLSEVVQERGPTAVTAPPELRVAFVRDVYDWRYGEASEAQRCIGSKLEALVPPVRIVSFDRLRMEFFPWLEFTTAPRTEEDLLRFLTQKVIHRKFEDLNLRYLIQVSGATTTDFGSGAVLCPYGCFGFAWGTRQSAFRITVIDLQSAITIASEAVTKQGDVYLPAFILPVPIIASTETEACQRLAERIHAIATHRADEARP
jgi:hypothetical protein